MSPELKQFYSEIQEWIDAGLPKHPIFTKDVGLCTSFARWAKEHKIKNIVTLLAEQGDAFVAAGYDRHCPFNNAAYPYGSAKSQYRNKKRLEWIKKHSEK